MYLSSQTNVGSGHPPPHFPFSRSYLLHLFSCFSIPSHSTRIVPLRFQAGCLRRQINLVLVLCVLIFCNMYFLIKDISAIVWLCVCVFVRLWIFSPSINLAASNFAWRFIGVLRRESPILGNFDPPEAQNRTNSSVACAAGLGWLTPEQRSIYSSVSAGQTPR